MPCLECGREASRLRRERCNACYMRLYRNGEVPHGAVCAGCGERRKALLTGVKLGEEIIVCGNCRLILGRTRPQITSIAALTRHAARERRGGRDRRHAARGGRRSGDRPGARVPVQPAFDPGVD